MKRVFPLALVIAVTASSAFAYAVPGVEASTQSGAAALSQVLENGPVGISSLQETGDIKQEASLTIPAS